MNKSFKNVVLLIVAFLGVLFANGQKNIVIKLNLANLIIEDFPTLQVEKQLFRNSSVQFGIGFYSSKHQSLPKDVLNSTINGKSAREVLFDEEKKFLLSFDFRQYLSKKKSPLNGFYVSPHVIVNYPLFEKLMIGANLGYQKIFKNNLLLNIGSGITKELSRKKISEDIATQPRLQIGIGWAF